MIHKQVIDDTLLGKYILENWVNGDFESNNLRHINRENKKYYISDTDRTAKDWRAKNIKYVHIYKWASKFFKDPSSKLGFRRSNAERNNNDGIMTYSVFISPAQCKCKYSFNELFNVDLRTVQNTEDYPLKMKLMEWDKWGKQTKLTEEEYFKIFLHEENPKPTDYNFHSTTHLKKLFGVSKVYRISEMASINEHHTYTKLSKSGTLFHVLHDTHIKELEQKKAHRNHTILFWLFDDKLVYQSESGKSTW